MDLSEYQSFSIRQVIPNEELLKSFFEAAWNEILVPLAGATLDPSEIHSFVLSHVQREYACTEYRFQGCLGFGGKFRVRDDLRCRVDCYGEDETPARRAVIDKVNAGLLALREHFIAMSAEPAASHST